MPTEQATLNKIANVCLRVVFKGYTPFNFPKAKPNNIETKADAPIDILKLIELSVNIKYGIKGINAPILKQMNE